MSLFSPGSDGYKDISVTFNGNTLSGITNGSTELAKDIDFTVSSSTVTILKSCLAKQFVGTTTLVFHFSVRSDAILTVAVSNTSRRFPSMGRTHSKLRASTAKCQAS